MSCFVFLQPVIAQESVAPITSVEVKGVLPGPGFWQVSNGTNNLWILGSVKPVPKGLDWETIKLERKINQSQELLGSVSVSLDTDLGFFAKLGLIPSLYRARKNPDGKTLKDVLPADVYARWVVLKAKYIGNDKDIEYWRPIFVAQELYEQAVKKSGMDNRNIAWPVAEKMAKKNDLPITRPEIKVTLSNPKKFIKDFSAKALNDTACFDKTLLSIERDVQNMSRRGQLWAEGNVSELQKMSFIDTSSACVDAIIGSEALQGTGMQGTKQRAVNAWLDAASKALAKNPNTFAVINMADLLKSDGYLARLQAKGYTVVAPTDHP
ncbi:MAG: TraB/GumN family protein [Arenimonas sp.]|nr:TraB/GumN family protein [Arenimonas sp.]